MITKLTSRKFNQAVKNRYNSSSNEDSDVIFDALVAADYINEIECTDGTCQQQA